jgi:iron complex transport system substrate-binding protein
MKSRLPALLVCLCALAFSSASHAQLSVRDDLNRTLIVKKTATRIVTLAPFLTEIVFAAGAGDLAVGVDDLSDYPAKAVSLPRIPTGANLALERIAKLRPDLILAWRDGIRREDVDRLTAAGATVYVAVARELEDIPRLMRVVGHLTGRNPTRAIGEFEGRLAQLRRENAFKVKMPTFIEIWNRPLTTVSGNHFLSEAIEICRGENVFAELRASAPKVTWEQVQSKNPMVIVGAGSASSLHEFRANWQLRQTMAAVRDERLLFVTDDKISRLTPRTPEGIAKLCAELDNVRAGRVQRVVDTSTTAASPGGAAPAGLGGFIPSVANPVVPLPAAAPGAVPHQKPTPAAPPAAPAGPPTAVAPETPRPKRPSQYGL